MNQTFHPRFGSEIQKSEIEREVSIDRSTGIELDLQIFEPRSDGENLSIAKQSDVIDQQQTKPTIDARSESTTTEETSIPESESISKTVTPPVKSSTTEPDPDTETARVMTTPDTSGDILITPTAFIAPPPPPPPPFETQPDTNSIGQNALVVIGAPAGLLSNDINPAALPTILEVNGSALLVGVPFAVSGGGMITILSDGGYTFDTSGSYLSLAQGMSTNEIITYQATDGVTISDSMMTVTINGINDTPTITADTFSINEDAIPTNSVGIVTTANDVDTNDVISYTLSGGTGAALFEVNVNTGEITVFPGATFDFESTLSYTLNITATDLSFASSNINMTININNINDESPVLDLDPLSVSNNFSVVYAPGPILISQPVATITDADGAPFDTLDSLTVTITTIRDAGQEFLTADISGTSILSNYNPTTGVLMLTGTDTIANYQTVLNTIEYENTSLTPNEADRRIEFVANDGANVSNVVATSIAVSDDIDISMLDGTDGIINSITGFFMRSSFAGDINGDGFADVLIFFTHIV